MPRRLGAVGAIVLACFLGGLAIGALAAGLTAVIALPWLSADDAPHSALAAALGAALGALLPTRSPRSCSCSC